jgi:hypothetical protein
MILLAFLGFFFLTLIFYAYHWDKRPDLHTQYKNFGDFWWHHKPTSFFKF